MTGQALTDGGWEGPLGPPPSMGDPGQAWSAPEGPARPQAPETLAHGPSSWAGSEGGLPGQTPACSHPEVLRPHAALFLAVTASSNVLLPRLRWSLCSRHLPSGAGSWRPRPPASTAVHILCISHVLFQGCFPDTVKLSVTIASFRPSLLLLLSFCRLLPGPAPRRGRPHGWSTTAPRCRSLCRLVSQGAGPQVGETIYNVSHQYPFLLLILTLGYFSIDFQSRGREGEKHRCERHIEWLLPATQVPAIDQN